MARFGTAVGLRLAEEQPRACCSGRLEFEMLGGLRGGSSAGVRTPAPEKQMRIVRIKGDGRCLFRALAKGLAAGQGTFLSADTEEADADELRMAVSDALCRSQERLKQFGEVVPSIEAVEGGLPNYCERLKQESFWGGEVEILVLSRMLKVPIYVFKTAEEAGRSDWGYVPIVKYGEEWAAPRGRRSARRPVKLLYTGSNHYDLLL